MAKGSRGLPPSFSLDVPSGLKTSPVQLEDYIDETSRRPAVPAPASTSLAELRPVRDNVVHIQTPPDLPREATPKASPMSSQEYAPQHMEWRANRAVPRKQLNMNPETLRMVDDLLETIKRYSGQKDAKASEMFHALVATLYEARELLDLQNIPPRGRWGSPTARAFPVALKNAFQAAIAQWHRRRGE